jgi:hypothetical protein
MMKKVLERINELKSKVERKGEDRDNNYYYHAGEIAGLTFALKVIEEWKKDSQFDQS